MDQADSEPPPRASSRTLDVFEAFGDAAKPLTLTELSRRIGVPLSTCHALLRTLQLRGYLYALDRRRGFYPTQKLLDVAREIARHDPLVNRIAPAMTRLRDRTGETVIAGRRQGDEVVYLAIVEGTHTIRYTSEIGARKPLHASAIGKAVLSRLSAAEFEAVLGRARPAPVTERTITSPAELWADLDEGRRRGHQRTRGENVADVAAIGMALEIAGETVAVAIAGPLSRMDAKAGDYAAALAEAVRAMSEPDIPA